jgi:alpha-amylase
MRKVILGSVIFLLCLAPSLAQNAGAAWDNETVWYEIFVRSFYDSDGDGIGDFQGVIQKLDYLNDGDPAMTDDLGITGIWLMPITDAQSYHGYDTLDYFDVEPDYGTQADFQQLLDEAHARGIRVIMDLVLNHTSSQHQWFIESSLKDEEYADWYIWADENPNYPGPWGAQAWHAKGGRYYYGVFWSEMPDLNYANPEVTSESYAIADFWLNEMGVDGFRLDAIRYVIEDEVNNNRLLQDAPLNRQWVADFTAHVKTVKPDATVVGEVFATTLVVSRYIDDNAVDLAFEFDLAGDILNAVRTGRASGLVKRLKDVQKTYDNRYAPFLTNHDQPRTATVLSGDIAQNKAAASILLTIPGSPFIYYGEEIGMFGSKPDERIRTPMQWDDTLDTAGFTTGRVWETLQEDYAARSVASMDADPDSLLNHYRGLIQLRNAHPALQAGDFTLLDNAPLEVVGYVRATEAETLLILVNLSDEAVSDYDITLRKGNLAGVTQAEIIFGEGEITAPTINEDGGFTDYIPLPELAPYSTTVITLK